MHHWTEPCKMHPYCNGVPNQIESQNDKTQHFNFSELRGDIYNVTISQSNE